MAPDKVLGVQLPRYPVIRDIHGYEVKPGDVIRIYHYRDRRTRRKCYMYKLVVLVTDDSQVSNEGSWLYCVCIPDIAKSGSLNVAHKCPLKACGNFEIVDGPSQKVDGDWQTWYERPKKVATEESR